MTLRLYYSDSYLAVFAARVVDRAGDGHRVYLDQTAFYPTSGGQPHDRGEIAGVPVIDVIDEGEHIAHLLSSPIADAGGVAGRIDWERRFDHMQQHTGQHLLSAVFADLFGWGTLSVHFGPQSSTLDLDVAAVGVDQLAAAERRANAIVAEARAVTVSFEEAGTVDLRKSSDRRGTLRVISIHDIDRSACGGTHVRSTAEIGAVLLRRVERVRHSSRIEFVCGRRAVDRARRDYESLSAGAAALSAPLDAVAVVAAAQVEQLRTVESDLKRARRELQRCLARDLYDGTVADEDGIRLMVLRDAASIDQLRFLAEACAALPKAVLIATLRDPTSIIFAASEDTGIDAGRVLKEALATVGGRGGGSPRCAQGSVSSLESLARLVLQLAGDARAR